jgi:Ni,Fe-hydrogenase maturation factor
LHIVDAVLIDRTGKLHHFQREKIEAFHRFARRTRHAILALGI